MRKTDTGEKWKFTKEGGFYVLEKDGSKSDNSIGCLNRTGGYADLDSFDREWGAMARPPDHEATFRPWFENERLAAQEGVFEGSVTRSPMRLWPSSAFYIDPGAWRPTVR